MYTIIPSELTSFMLSPIFIFWFIISGTPLALFFIVPTKCDFFLFRSVAS